MPKLRGLLIGYGGMGKDWCRVLADHPVVELAGIVELRVVAQKLARQALGVPVYDGLAEALQYERVDFVLDCSPPAAHGANTRLAVTHGCHVLGEKPIALTLKEAEDIVMLAAKAKRVYMVNQNYRWHPHIRVMKSLLQTGRLGRVQTINILYSQNFAFTDTFRYEMDHPFLFDMAVHHFDLVRCLTDARATRVYCVESNPLDSPFRSGSAATAIFTLSDDTTFTYQGSWSDTGHFTDFMGTWRIVCKNGVITWNGAQTPLIDGPRTHRIQQAMQKQCDAAASMEALRFHGQLRASLDAFIAAILSGNQPETSSADNIHTLVMVLSAIQSAAKQTECFIGNPLDILS